VENLLAHCRSRFVLANLVGHNFGGWASETLVNRPNFEAGEDSCRPVGHNFLLLEERSCSFVVEEDSCLLEVQRNRRRVGNSTPCVATCVVARKTQISLLYFFFREVRRKEAAGFSCPGTSNPPKSGTQRP